MRYPGGKGKCYQHIINLLPPHETYIETHLGGGAVLRHKKPARVSIGIDCDPAVIRNWQSRFPFLASYIEADALEFITSRHFAGDEVVYCDPPYLPSTRRRARVYSYDYAEYDHVKLLESLRSAACRVLVSGYPSELYDECLCTWNTRMFAVKAHDGLRQEKLWFNFEPPPQLHDSRYLGRNFRDRQTIKRRMQRLQRRISTLSSQEKHHLWEWLEADLYGDDSDAGLLFCEG